MKYYTYLLYLLTIYTILKYFTGILYCIHYNRQNTILYDDVHHRHPYKQAVGDPKINEDVEESSQEYTLENEDGTTTTVMRQMKKVTRTVKQTVIQVRMKMELQQQSNEESHQDSQADSDSGKNEDGTTTTVR